MSKFNDEVRILLISGYPDEKIIEKFTSSGVVISAGDINSIRSTIKVRKSGVHSVVFERRNREPTPEIEVQPSMSF